MTDASRLARIFKVLSSGRRVRIIQLLKGRALCVNALARRLRVSPAAISQHLRVLRNARIVVAERRGYYVHYRLDGRNLVRWKGLAERLLSPEEK